MRGAYAIHPEAFNDIDEIAAFIGRDSAEAAHRVVDDIYLAIQNLVSFPNGGHRRTDLIVHCVLSASGITSLRMRPDENPLWVIAVMHGHRNSGTMAAILRGREEP